MIKGISITIILAITLLVSIHWLRSKGRDEIWFIPEDHRGWLVIVPDQKNGVDAEYENGSLVYRFPDSGILKIRYGMNYGWKKVENYLISGSGERTNLFYTYNCSDLEKIEEGEPYLFFGFTREGGLPYPSVYATVLKEKGKEETLDLPELEDFLASGGWKKEASIQAVDTAPLIAPQ